MEVHRAIGDLNRVKLTELLQDDREPIDLTKVTFEPCCEKTGLRGFQPIPTQTGLYSHRRWLDA